MVATSRFYILKNLEILRRIPLIFGYKTHTPNSSLSSEDPDNTVHSLLYQTKKRSSRIQTTMASASSESAQEVAKRCVQEPWSSTFDPSSISNSALHELAFLLFQPSAESIGIPNQQLRTFLSLVQNNYLANPYHCWAHAVHVTFNAWRLARDLVDSSSFDEFDQFILLFSAIIHDLHHPGHTNMVEIESRSPLARLYNDQSVIENNSLAKAYELVDSIQLFDGLTKEKQFEVRIRVVEMVLATDISPPTGKDRATLMASKWNAAFAGMLESGAGGVDSGAGDSGAITFHVETLEQRQCVLVRLLCIADLGSAMQPFSVFANWSQRLYVENNLCTGLTHEGHVNTQKPFMEYLCVPLVMEASRFPILKNIEMLKELLESNLQRWNGLSVEEKCSAIETEYIQQPENVDVPEKEGRGSKFE